MIRTLLERPGNLAQVAQADMERHRRRALDTMARSATVTVVTHAQGSLWARPYAGRA